MSGTVRRPRAGIATMSIDGVAYDVAGDAAYFANKVKRATLIGQSGVQEFSEMPMAPYIGATIRDAGSLTVGALNALTNSTVVLTLSNGKLVYGDGMWTTEVEEVKTQEGTFSVRFEGYDVFEQVTA